MNEIIIYQLQNSQIEVSVQLDKDTVWLNQSEITTLFERDQSVISRHINNVFKEAELDKKSNMQKMHIANSDKPVFYYSLDVIISVISRHIKNIFKHNELDEFTTVAKNATVQN